MKRFPIRNERQRRSECSQEFPLKCVICRAQMSTPVRHNATTLLCPLGSTAIPLFVAAPLPLLATSCIRNKSPFAIVSDQLSSGSSTVKVNRRTGHWGQQYKTHYWHQAGAMGTRPVQEFCQDEYGTLAFVNMIWYQVSVFVWFPTKHIRFAVYSGAFL